MPINQDDIANIIIPLAGVLLLLVMVLLWKGERKRRIDSRIARVTSRKPSNAKSVDVVSLRRKSQESVPFISKMLAGLPTQAALTARLERAGLQVTSDRFVLASAGAFLFVAALVVLAGKPIFAGILAGVITGVVIPYFATGYMGAKRVKKFLVLFPDAIDFIVRGLKSGLPVTESMNIVGREMQEPVGSIFATMGESVRLGVSLDKAMQDTARKLHSTEFNFFVTSIILQRETGGNLSEILTNLSDVLRKRMMMRLKIKAMSSEAKASALIIASLPFVVIGALLLISPSYLDPLVDTARGNIIALGCLFSMGSGIGIMIKMTKFEI